MPRSGGLDLLAKMRQDARLKHQKVIFCSGVNERSAVLQTAALGISAYLLKPFAIEGFLDRVRRVYNTTPKKNSPQEEPAETPETVIKRLGIGLSVYQKLIEMFTNDVDELVATLRNASQLELKQEIEVKLCAINGASRTLGATGLAKLVEQLERAWTAGDEAALYAIIPLIGLENMKVAAAARDMTG
jgi:CheY-like chemotaxis protein